MCSYIFKIHSHYEENSHNRIAMKTFDEFLHEMGAIRIFRNIRDLFLKVVYDNGFFLSGSD